jgi:hypothetical protein
MSSTAAKCALCVLIVASMALVHLAGRRAGSRGGAACDGYVAARGSNFSAAEQGALRQMHHDGRSFAAIAAALGRDADAVMDEFSRQTLHRRCGTQAPSAPKVHSLVVDAVPAAFATAATAAGGTSQDAAAAPTTLAAQSSHPAGWRRCTGDQATRGRWVYNASFEPPYDGSPKSVGPRLSSCWRANRSVAPAQRYQWRSSECDLEPFTADAFCRALRGRSLMLVGDSLTDQWHQALYKLLGGKRNLEKRKRPHGPKQPICNDVAGDWAVTKQQYLDFSNAPYLAKFIVDRDPNGKIRRNWAGRVHHYDIAVINSGTWMLHPNNGSLQLSMDEWKGFMRGAAKLLRPYGASPAPSKPKRGDPTPFNGTLIWRTLYSGHPHCHNYTEPLTEPLPLDEIKAYRWDEIPARNAFAAPLWRGVGAKILDITRPTNLMAVGHLSTDCLHYCAPGAYDTWSMLLLNVLTGNISD